MVDACIAQLWHELYPDDDRALANLSIAEAVVYPTVHHVERAAAVTIGTLALAASEFRVLRNPVASRNVSVDGRHAAVMFRSERFLRINGEPAGEGWSPTSGFYQTRDGWVQLHTNFHHHLLAAVRATRAAGETRADLEAALAMMTAQEVEDAIVECGGCSTRCRSAEEWKASPQGTALLTQPLVGVERISCDDAGPLCPLPPIAPDALPLHGVRVLDLTRIVAGPVCTRNLALYGADVLHVQADKLPTMAACDADTSFGKRWASLDLDDEADAERLRALVAEADVVVQAYRPGSLARRGFGVADLVALRPGLVVVELTAYGWEGPWRERRGYDSLVQTASGIAAAEASARGSAKPVHLPAQVMDHGTGCLAALGAIVALHRRERLGGSYHVRISLARTARWFQDMGLLAPAMAQRAEPTLADVSDLIDTLTFANCAGQETRAAFVKPAGVLGGVPMSYRSGPASLRAHDDATWMPR